MIVKRCSINRLHCTLQRHYRCVSVVNNLTFCFSLIVWMIINRCIAVIVLYCILQGHYYCVFSCKYMFCFSLIVLNTINNKRTHTHTHTHASNDERFRK